MAVNALRFVSFFAHASEVARGSDWQPATDIYKTPTGWLVKMELAGVRADDLALALEGRTLVVRGRRRDECPGEICRQLHMEISYSRFERRIELPGDLQAVSVETEFHDGMLHIRIRREEKA